MPVHDILYAKWYMVLGGGNSPMCSGRLCRDSSLGLCEYAGHWTGPLGAVGQAVLQRAAMYQGPGESYAWGGQTKFGQGKNSRIKGI